MRGMNTLITRSLYINCFYNAMVVNILIILNKVK